MSPFVSAISLSFPTAMPLTNVPFDEVSRSRHTGAFSAGGVSVHCAAEMCGRLIWRSTVAVRPTRRGGSPCRSRPAPKPPLRRFCRVSAHRLSERAQAARVQPCGLACAEAGGTGLGHVAVSTPYRVADGR
eukprot:4145414-Prymnesium_polylepis.1